MWHLTVRVNLMECSIKTLLKFKNLLSSLKTQKNRFMLGSNIKTEKENRDRQRAIEKFVYSLHTDEERRILL